MYGSVFAGVIFNTRNRWCNAEVVGAIFNTHSRWCNTEDVGAIFSTHTHKTARMYEVTEKVFIFQLAMYYN